MIARLVSAALVVLLASTASRADDAVSVFAQFKRASGGAHWDKVSSLGSTGSLAVGGLDGSFESIVDVHSGRSSSQYKLGSLEGAQGFDGNTGWSRDPGGEVAELDAEDARKSARTQAWLDARGYWNAARMQATLAEPVVRKEDGRSFTVVVATPHDADPVTLWFDASTHLLDRIDQKQGADTAMTRYDDWREVDGLRLPLHFITDLADTAGRVDPRNRTEVRVTRYAFNPAISDADFSKPAMAATARIESPSGITRIRFELVNNHIYALGSINGSPAKFLVDTGGSNLLTPASAKKFGIQGEGKLAGRGVGDALVDVALAHAKSVRLGDAVLDNPVFAIMDLGKLAEVEGYECDGLVGYEMFRRFAVTIDYAAHELVLAEPTRFVVPKGAQALPFELADRIPIIHGELDGLPVRISVDTGSRVSLTLHSPFVHENALVAKYRPSPDAVIGWGVGGPSRGQPARFGDLNLGGIAIRNIAGDLYTGNKGAFASPDVSGNLGGGVLKRFTVAFDYAARKMYLAPNSAFANTDDFDRSGLWLLGDGDALKIADVADASAAAEAGLHAADRIVSIDDEPVNAKTLDHWRRWFRETPAGTQVAIDYSRSGKPGKVTLTQADRIPAQSAAAIN